MQDFYAGAPAPAPPASKLEQVKIVAIIVFECTSRLSWQAFRAPNVVVSEGQFSLCACKHTYFIHFFLLMKML